MRSYQGEENAVGKLLVVEGVLNQNDDWGGHGLGQLARHMV
jgi:hypothetical protein